MVTPLVAHTRQTKPPLLRDVSRRRQDPSTHVLRQQRNLPAILTAVTKQHRSSITRTGSDYEPFSLVFSPIKSSENSILGGEPTIPQEKMGCKKFKKKYGIERFLTNESKESIFEKNIQLLVGPQASFLRPLFRPSSHNPGEGEKKISPGNCADLHFRSPRKKMQKKSIRLVE